MNEKKCGCSGHCEHESAAENASTSVEVLEMTSRVVPEEKGAFAVYALLRTHAATHCIHVVSVEVDNLELLPSAKVAFSSGESLTVVPPVRIINPTGEYELKVKLHTQDGISEHKCWVEF